MTRTSRWRWATLAAIHLLFLAHWAHGRWFGATLAPLELSEAFRTLHLGELTLGFLLAVAAVLATLAFGRYFCGWGCHLLALQDLATEGLSRLGWGAETGRWRVLRAIPWVLLAWLVAWPLVLRGWPDLVVAADGFWTADPWRNLPGPAMGALTLLVSGPVLVAALGPRSFCRDVCPYGAVFGVAERLTPVRLVLGPGCTDCGACNRACRSNVDVLGWLRTDGAVRDAACVRDLDCVSACPTASIRVEAAPVRLGKAPVRSGAPLGEEIAVGAVAIATTITLAGLYDAVPVLLATALGVLVATSLVRMRRPTWGRTLAAGLAVCLLVVAVPRRIAEVRAELAWRQGSADALPRLEALADGLYTSPTLHQRLASAYLAEGRTREARDHLRAALTLDPGDTAARRVLQGLGG